MADALVSPAVGGTLWAASAGLIVLCAGKVKRSGRDNLVPMMGVLGAFVFAAQMINFAVPGTGSSGHLGGGLILTVLLGPYAAFLVMASVLTVQAFFFADGGLLALGCNIFNLGFFPVFVAYPLLYRVVSGNQLGTRRTWIAAVVAAPVGLLLGATCVVLETTASGISDLPLGTFMVVMLPMHLAIGVVEGVATAAIFAFVARVRPEALPATPASVSSIGMRPVLAGFAAAALVLGGVGSWLASTRPDGLEWSIAKVMGKEEVAGVQSESHRTLAAVQKKTSILPGYGFKPAETEPGGSEDTKSAWPAVSAGTSASGIVGGLATLAVTALVGLALTLRRSAV